MTRYPALVMALSWSAALTTAVVMFPEQPAVGAVAIAAAVPFFALAFLLRPALIALAVVSALLAVGRAELPPVDPAVPLRAAALAGSTVLMTGRVADDSRSVAGGAEVLVEPNNLVVGVTKLAGVGNLLVRWRGPTQASYGDLMRASGRLTLPRDLPGFDRRAYLSQRQVYLELQASSFDVTSSAAGPGALPSWLRSRYIADVNAALPAPHAAVLLGIVLGIRQGIPAELQNALIATGLIHLLVLSGLKVAVFARIVQGALNPSAIGGLAIAASHLGRPSHVWTSLAVTAAAMLGWHPELAWDVGFQLSFAGTAAIILLTPAIARQVAFLPHVLREPFAVTCAAQVGTLPMMAADFHVLSPVAPIANALTLPILPALVACGLVLGALSFTLDLARMAAVPVAGLLAYIEQVGYVLARVPAAAITIPTFPTWLGAAYYSALGPAVAAAHSSGDRRKAGLVVAGLAPAAIALTSLALWANAPPQAVVMNVGDGQAILLRGPQGTILIDGGPSPAKLRDELGSQLPPWQSTLDAILITAPGLGHIGGFAGFDRPANTLVLPDAQLTGSAWRTAAFEAAARGASIQTVTAGRTMHLAGFKLEILAPEPGAPGDQIGAAYLAVRAVAPDGRSFCDFSDLDDEAQTVAATRLKNACSNLLLPAGGRSRLSPELERIAINASTQLIASRPSGRLANSFPPTVLRTDQEGTITLPL